MKFVVLVSVLFVGALAARSCAIRKRNPEIAQGLFEGDILGEPTELRSAVRDEKYRWPRGVLVYRFNGTFSRNNRRSINEAMKQITSRTSFNRVPCITFRQATDDDKDIVMISNFRDQCSSFIGKIGGQQTMLLGGGCFSNGWGTSAHEFLHALGIYHEQSRSDRDEYVQIIEENIIPQNKGNFNKVNPSTENNFTIPYDYSSIMHYASDAFSVNPPTAKTIKSKIEGKDSEMGQRRTLTNCDVVKMRRMYNCQGSSPVPTNCKA